jgi:hypothetical protein
MQFAQGSDTRRRVSYNDFIRARCVQIKSARRRREMSIRPRAFNHIRRQ